MNREQLAHVLRAASRVVEDPEILVIGSQSLLASYSSDELPLGSDSFDGSRPRLLRRLRRIES